jgi:hypothetical protein
MVGPFHHVDRHWTEARALGQSAVVFSELPRGDSPVTVATRSIKFVIEGTERYEFDGRSHVVKPGEFLIVEAGVAGRPRCRRRSRPPSTRRSRGPFTCRPVSRRSGACSNARHAS